MQNFERRAIATARHMTQKTKQMMSSIGMPLYKLPGVVQPVFDLMSSSVAGATNVSVFAVAEFTASLIFNLEICKVSEICVDLMEVQ